MFSLRFHAVYSLLLRLLPNLAHQIGKLRHRVPPRNLIGAVLLEVICRKVGRKKQAPVAKGRQHHHFEPMIFPATFLQKVRDFQAGKAEAIQILVVTPRRKDFRAGKAVAAVVPQIPLQALRDFLTQARKVCQAGKVAEAQLQAPARRVCPGGRVVPEVRAAPIVCLQIPVAELVCPVGKLVTAAVEAAT